MRYLVLSPLLYGSPTGDVTLFMPGDVAELPEAAMAQAVEASTLLPDPLPDPPAQPK